MNVGKRNWVSVFQQEFREDLRWWIETNPRAANRVLEIVESVLREPFSGIGKPEPLKHLGDGMCARRLTQEHRVVYKVMGERIDFLQCRYHY